jgi:PAS domain-containing protein
MRAFLDEHPEVVRECRALFKVIDVNRASLALYKADRKEDLVGDLLPLVPAAVSEAQKKILIAIAAGETSYEVETVNLTLTGDPINVIVGWQVAPSYEDSYARVLVSIVDITPLRRAQAASAQLAAIVESSSDAIIGATLDGVISSWNPGAERLYGYSADEAIGRSALILYPEDRTDDLAWILEQAAREHIANFGRCASARQSRSISPSRPLPLRQRQRDYRRPRSSRDIGEHKQQGRRCARANASARLPKRRPSASS